MLVRKLKLKYIDRNMAFAEDAWALQNRPDDQSIMSKSQLSFMKTVNLKSPTTVIEKYPNSKFKSNKVTFGSSPFGSSLPHIKGAGSDDTRNDLLRQSLQKSIDRTIDRTPDVNEHNLNTPAKRLYNFIVAEVRKFVQTKRVSEQGIMELDQKVHYEAYIREKKDAILEDRKATIFDDDQRSHVSVVKDKYAGLGEAMDAKSKASSIV